MRNAKQLPFKESTAKRVERDKQTILMLNSILQAHRAKCKNFREQSTKKRKMHISLKLKSKRQQCLSKQLHSQRTQKNKDLCDKRGLMKEPLPTQIYNERMILLRPEAASQLNDTRSQKKKIRKKWLVEVKTKIDKLAPIKKI